MIRDHLRFGMQTYQVLLDDHNLGEPPTTLGGGAVYYTDEEMAQLREQAYAELGALGVARGRQVDQGLVDTVTVMQRPAVEYYTFAYLGGASWTVRTAATGRDSVLVISDGTVIDIYPGDTERLPEQLISALPQVPPANVHSLSCRNDDYEAALADKSVSGGSSGRDAKLVLRWMKLPRTQGGQLFAATRKNTGGRSRCARPAHWFDTDHGRILCHLDGTDHLGLVAGTPEKMTARLRQLEGETR